jgi:non-specific serine/threonine protein kinase
MDDFVHPPQRYRYRFGTAEFDEARFELRVGGLPIEVQRKPLEILLFLMSHCDEVVTKGELLDRLWGVATVENVLPNAMTKLRLALGDQNAARIVTLARIGYRFDGPLERTAVGGALRSAMNLAAGMPVPGRKNFILTKLIGRSQGSDVWTAHQAKSGEARVYKFSRDGEKLAGLRREATLSRVLRAGLGAREDIAWILDWNFESAPFFLECEFGGQNLLEWAAENDRLRTMPLKARLGVFLQITDAVSAAHGVGVLHKDIKPSNVLVMPKDGRWQVRLTDFGSGGLLDPGRLQEIGLSLPNLFMTETDAGTSGTPLYLAPELIAGQVATLRSDIYALGLILYQIVVGDLMRPLAPGWERDIADEFLRADIALATDGDPLRRLDSAAELARRLRSLEERREEQAWQRATDEAARVATEAIKRSRARRPWVVATIAALGVGLVASLALAVQLRQSEKNLADELSVSKTLQNFLTDDLIAAADPSVTGRSDITVIEAAKSAAAKIDDAFMAAPPRIRAALHGEMQQSFMGLTDYEAAVAEGRRALAALRLEPKPDQRRIAETELTTANALGELARFSDARTLIDEAEQTLAGPAFAGTEVQARFWLEKGQLAVASLALPENVQDTEKAWAVTQHIPDVSPHFRDVVEFSLADAYRLSGKLPEAEAAFREVIARQTGEYGAADERPNFAVAGLASVLGDEGRYDEALALLQKAVPIVRAALGPENQRTLDAQKVMADILFNMKNYDAAIAIWTEVAAAEGRKLGDTSLYYLSTQMSIAMARHRQGQISVAADLLRQSLGKAQTAFKPTDPLVEDLRYKLADCLLDLKESEEAARLLDGLEPEALNMSTQEPAWDGLLAYQVGRLALQRGDRAKAISSLTMARDVLAAKDPDNPLTKSKIAALIAEASLGDPSK